MSAARPEQLAPVLKALACPRRLEILRLLRRRALCVGALAARLGVTQGGVSQHLDVLRRVGLLRAQRRGHFMHYLVNLRAVARCAADIKRLLRDGP